MTTGPWSPPDFELPDAAALKAMKQGIADPDQQRRAYNYLVYRLCGLHRMSYIPGSELDTAFAEGRRFVGICLEKFTNTPMDELKASLDPPTRKNDGRRSSTSREQPE